MSSRLQINYSDMETYSGQILGMQAITCLSVVVCHTLSTLLSTPITLASSSLRGGLTRNLKTLYLCSCLVVDCVSVQIFCWALNIFDSTSLPFYVWSAGVYRLGNLTPHTQHSIVVCNMGNLSKMLIFQAAAYTNTIATGFVAFTPLIV